jgi:hypothetical protein
MRATANKLRAALDRLVRGAPEHTASRHRIQRLTVAALAREAGVGRNAVYANHRDILDDLARARRRRLAPDRIGSMEEKIAEQRAVIDDMQLQIRRLATENAGLLRRAVDAERLAERVDRRNALLTREIDAHRRSMLLRQTKT